MKKRIAIFASGSGTNAENFFEYFRSSDQIEIALLLSNKSDAYVLQRAQNHNIKSATFTKEDIYKSSTLCDLLIENRIDFIVLAGFLWLVPKSLIQAYPEKIINIHPALLPKYGGKGMYGMKVHEAVKEAGEMETGITIHLVNEVYDDGKILSQKTVSLESTDTPNDIAKKVHTLEYRHFPKVVEEYVVDLR